MRYFVTSTFITYYLLLTKGGEFPLHFKKNELLPLFPLICMTMIIKLGRWIDNILHAQITFYVIKKPHRLMTKMKEITPFFIITNFFIICFVLRVVDISLLFSLFLLPLFALP